MDEQKNNDVLDTGIEFTPEAFNVITISMSSNSSIGQTLIDVINALKSIK